MLPLGFSRQTSTFVALCWGFSHLHVDLYYSDHAQDDLSIFINIIREDQLAIASLVAPQQFDSIVAKCAFRDVLLNYWI